MSIQPSAKSLKLLVIDDETSIQKIISHFFKGKHQVLSCNNGKEALEWLYKGNEVDFIVADINMPLMNGYDFIEAVRSSGYFRSIPLLMLSGIDNTDTRIKCLEAGADDFMTKPFNPRELEARISAIAKRAIHV